VARRRLKKNVKSIHARLVRWNLFELCCEAILASPVVYIGENHKAIKAKPLLAGPRADAPGRFPIAEPTRGRGSETVMGRVVKKGRRESGATGPCCHKPDWINAGCTTDEDRVPCYVCKKGIMLTSEHGIS